MTAKQSIERADLDSLLRRLAQLEEFTPISIHHRKQESPDFILELAEETIGLEATRSVHQEYVRAMKLQARECPKSWVNLTHLRDRSKRRSSAEIHGSMLSGLSAPWKRVDQSMMEWKDKIGASLLAKRRALNRPNYQTYGQNWLLIHDTPGLPDYPGHIEFACQHLSELFREPAPVARDFDCVFVHSHLLLFRWTKDGLDYNYDKHEGNKITGANAGGRRQLPERTRRAARVAQFHRSAEGIS
jgi:hypothetical protein